MAETDISKVVELTRQLTAMGCAVVVFTEEELRGVAPKYVEERLIELGFEVIDIISDEIESERLETPSEEDWNWSIK